MSDVFLTPADLLVKGLGLGPLAVPTGIVGTGISCAITGQPITAGYRVMDMVTDATAEFLDCFRNGGVHGWVSETAARCFKNADPRGGNPTARAVMVFEDGTYYNPLIARDSAVKLSRPCWSDLVRQVWPERRGQPVLIILTTDMKKRLWPRCRVGALGERTPVYYHDADTCGNGNLYVDWPAMLQVLDLVEAVYNLGFTKRGIRASLYGEFKTALAVGMAETRRWEREVAGVRGNAEFAVATLIAQKESVE